MARKAHWNPPLLGFRTHKWWKELIASIYYGIVLIFVLMSIIKYDGTDVSLAMAIFFSTLLIVPIVIGIVKRPKGKKSAESGTVKETKPIEEPREIVRADKVVKYKSLHKTNLKLHPDLEGLIWFSDGSMKNCPDSLEFDPSAIQTSLPIVMPASANDVSPLGYYPSYSGMSDFQRGVYIRYLGDPYQKIDIGYVFVLYYGLERYLLSANYKRAFDVILKLRDVHKNASFQSYSATALIYTAILHDRKDLLRVFLQSIDTEHEKQISFDIFVLSKKAFSNGIYPEELIKYASSFGFTNKRYMVANYSSFVSHLSNVLIEKYGTAAYPTESLQIAELPTVETRAFANYTLKQTVSISDISYAHQFIEEGADLLQEAHNRVKCELRTAKASGAVSSKVGSKEYPLNNENSALEMHQYAQRISVALTKELAKNNLGERILQDISVFGKNELFSPELEEITTQMSFRTLTSGERPKALAKELIAAFPELEYKSVCGAFQTKCAIASAARVKYRALDLGLNWYIWRTSRDGDRVRKHHQYMEGVICNWNDPPNPERLFDGSKGKCVHPGYDTQCRCIALNVVDLENIEFPAKVHVMGEIKTVTSLRKMQKLDKQDELQR